MAARFDERTLRDLASDTGEPVADLASDGKIGVALEDASGRVDSALTVANLYSADDLAGLTGNSLALLKRIVCGIAMGYLWSRRHADVGNQDLHAAQQEAEEYLDRLRKGERLFASVAAARDAGTPEVDGPSALDYENLNLLPDRTKNFYPARATRLPVGRG